MNAIVLFMRLSRPLFLLGVAMLYALGVGIARYLGVTIDWSVYIIGQIWVSLLQLGTQYLNEYFNSPADRENQNRTYITGGSGATGPGKLSLRVPLIAALTCLAFLASITVVLIANVNLSPLALVIMLFAFLGSFFYSTPPVKLEGSGYGELTTSIIVAFLVPAYAFVLQVGELHRLVVMSVFPLVGLHLSMLLAFEFPDYAADIKFEKRTILIRMGWQNGMFLHNILILSAFLLMGLAAIFGMPMFVFLAALISLPLGILQIWQMRRIGDGAKRNWNHLTIGALALFVSMAYFITFAYWTH
jgi:1,4-dihydroxy-2-naphthoate octaprenyltransferase